MKTIFALITLFIISVSAAAQQTDLSALSKTESGKRVLAYFAALNSGDDQKLRDFFSENVAAESLKQRPVEARVEFHKRVRNDFPALEIKQISPVGDSEIKVLAQSKNGNWVAISFAFENQTQKINGMGIDPADAPNSTENPKYNPPTNKAEFLSTVEKFLNDKVAADEFSGVVLIAEKDKPVFSKAYGLANREKNLANKSDTKFNLGSINKIFTRIAIGQLVQQGKISFDDKIGKILPDYPNKDVAEKVTIRHLVTMTSGIGDIFNDKFDALREKLRTNADYLPLFASNPLEFEPGTSQRYSNGSYVLLGAIIEKVSGKSYYDYVRENIFKVAGMSNTESFEADKMPSNAAEGYTKRNPSAKWTNNLSTRPMRGSAAGGGYSTSEDLLKFSMALQGGKLTIPDDNGQPQKEVRTGVAGGADGINALLLVNGQTGYTIIVLSNYDPPSAEKVGTQLRDWLKQIQQ
ncbi:MAG TPA: serine hydrolase domain-containing protein [Pyrinomonadaceae bacterium]|jgi:CubicO group peptidase (beta-lactamase class C family)